MCAPYPDREIDDEVDEKERKIISLIEALQNENPEGVSLRDIYRKAPNEIGRSKKTIQPIVQNLHQQGKITPVKIGKKEVWKVSA